MNTFNDFVKFISDDPVMLGLCIAIAFLIVIFIIVLCIGGKKKKKEIKDNVDDNTTSLLKVDNASEELHSTQEFKMNAAQNQVQENLKSKVEIPAEEPLQTSEETEHIVEDESSAPISLNEVLELKNERETEIEPIPVETTIQPKPVEFPSFDEIKINPEPPVKPAADREIFSSVSVNNSDELPKVEVPSDTQIIRHIPETPEPIVTEAETINEEPLNAVEDSLDNVELPKLNKNEETSVINTLNGETFNLK